MKRPLLHLYDDRTVKTGMVIRQWFSTEGIFGGDNARVCSWHLMLGSHMPTVQQPLISSSVRPFSCQEKGNTRGTFFRKVVCLANARARGRTWNFVLEFLKLEPRFYITYTAKGKLSHSKVSLRYDILLLLR